MRNITLAISFLFALGCREPFNPDIAPSDLTVLVVEGYLDTEGMSSILQLGYTRNIQSEDNFSPSYPVASVFLESLQGEQYSLTDLGGGKYEFAHDIAEEDSYRLRIISSDGRSYSSEFMKPILTPEIIEVGFERNEIGAEVYVTTKGDENADDFLWTYEETYAFRPKIASSFKYDPETKDIVYRNPDERTDLCYRGGPSSDLILETSSRFQDQFVFRQSIKQILIGDERLSVRYSILISQKALDKKASEFWEILRKNTDDLGSIFSPMPSNISSNVSNDQDPGSPVIGYVSLGTVKQKRLFIDIREVTPWNTQVPEYFGCMVEPDTIFRASYENAFGSGNFVPTTPIIPDRAPAPIGFQGAPRRCTDCTLRGTIVKPDFWED